MKKLIAFALLITFAFSTLCVSANAANIVIKQPTSINDGVASFDPTTTTSTVSLNVGTTSDRYAVDIVFDGTTTFSTGNYTWNVSTLQYETTGANFTNTTYTCTVTNYSAGAIDVEYDIDVNTDLKTAGADITVTNIEASDTYVTDSPDYNAQMSNNNHTVNGTLQGVNKEPDAGERDVTTATFTAYLATTDGKTWGEVANNLINNTDTTAGSITIAEFTVTISMTPTNP